MKILAKTNRYDAPCFFCDAEVPAGDGRLAKLEAGDPGFGPAKKWVAIHYGCASVPTSEPAPLNTDCGGCLNDECCGHCFCCPAEPEKTAPVAMLSGIAAARARFAAKEKGESKAAPKATPKVKKPTPETKPSPALDLSPCCGAVTTFVDDVLCCKVCYATVSLSTLQPTTKTPATKAPTPKKVKKDKGTKKPGSGHGHGGSTIVIPKGRELRDVDKEYGGKLYKLRLVGSKIRVYCSPGVGHETYSVGDFDSPTAAAKAVTGWGTANGWQFWYGAAAVKKDGRTVARTRRSK